MKLTKNTFLVFLFGILATSVLVVKIFPDYYLIPKQLYFLFLSVIIFIFLGISGIFAIGNKTLIFDKVDLAIIAYSIYIPLNYVFFKGISDVEQELYVILFCSGFYFFIKGCFKRFQNQKVLKYLIAILFLFPFFQSIYGYLQLLAILPNYIQEYKVGGSFGNSGIFSNFISVIVPLALSVAIFKNYQKPFRVFAWIVFFFTLIILIFTNSRTSWLAVFIGIVLVISFRLKIWSTLLKAKMFIKLPVFLLSTLLALFILVQLYHYKKDSSEGRYFVWQNTLKGIAETPVFGTGFNTFSHEHNIRQAEYFKTHPDDVKTGYLADNIIFAFNDYLQLASETGLVGLLLFLAIIFLAIKAYFKSTHTDEQGNELLFPFFASFVVILVSSFVSYPLQEISIYLYFMILLAVISSGNNNQVYTIRLNAFAVRPLLIITVIFFLIFINTEVKRLKSNLEWGEASENILKGKTDEALKLYNNAIPDLQYSGAFLYNLGAELSKLGLFEESLDVLSACEAKINDADFYVFLGNTFEGLGKFDEAEQAFTRASFIIPHKLYPRYRLAKLYIKKNETELAIKIAKSVVVAKPKVVNSLSTQIQQELEQLISKYSNH